MGKRSRIKQGKPFASQVANTKVPNTNNTFWNRTKAFVNKNKRKLITYGVAGSVALGALKYHSEVPYWTGAKNGVHLGMIFAPHLRESDALHIQEALARAHNNKRPYHLVLLEASGTSKKEFDKITINWNKKLDEMRKDFEFLLLKGMNKEEAVQKVREHYKRFSKEGFFSEIQLVIALSGARVMPAEAYDAKTLERIKALDEKINAAQTKWNHALRTNAPLIVIQKGNRETSSIARELADVREKPTIASMKENIANARKFFPELRNEKEIRVLSHFGTYHKEGLAPSNFSSRRINAYEEKLVPVYSLMEFAARKRGQAANFDEFSSRFETLSLYIDETLRELMHGNALMNVPKNPELAKKIYATAVKTSQEEFEKLSELSAPLKGKGRVNFLLNYFIQKGNLEKRQN